MNAALPPVKPVMEKHRKDVLEVGTLEANPPPAFGSYRAQGARGVKK